MRKGRAGRSIEGSFHYVLGHTADTPNRPIQIGCSLLLGNGVLLLQCDGSSQVVFDFFVCGCGAARSNDTRGNHGSIEQDAVLLDRRGRACSVIQPTLE